MRKTSGISLIVLVITIIVSLILTSAIVINIYKNNPIQAAQEVKFKQNLKTYVQELSKFYSDQRLETGEQIDPATLYATKTTGTYNDMTIQEIIPVMPDDYASILEINAGVLVYVGNDLTEAKYATQINVPINIGYFGEQALTYTDSSVIDKNVGTIEAWVQVTNDMRTEVADKYIFSTYADEDYTNMIALRHTRDNKWQAVMSSDLRNISNISATDSLAEGWHNFAIKWSATEFSLFINGTKVATTATPKRMTSVPSSWYIGSGPRLNLVKNGYAELGNNTNFPNITYTTSDYYSPSSAFAMTGYLNYYTTDFIKVDTNKKYIQSGRFKSTGAGGLSKLYYGTKNYDKGYNEINDFMTNHYINTETQLARDLKSGDTVVYLNSVANWSTPTSKYIGIYPYLDYPDYTYTRTYSAYTTIDTVNKALNLSAAYNGVTKPAGTKVAQLYGAYGSYNYNTVQNSLVPTSWTQYTSEITGAQPNTASWRQFRNATQYVSIEYLINYSQTTAFTTVFDDIIFRDSVGATYNAAIRNLSISNDARSDSELLTRYQEGKITKDDKVKFILNEN